MNGYALGESIAGAEPTPLAAYLLGLVAIQAVIATGVALLARAGLRRMPRPADFADVPARQRQPIGPKSNFSQAYRVE